MKTVLVPLANGCEEMEAITITDILTRGGAEVVTAGLENGLVTASRGAKLMPDTTLSEILDRTFDLIALPGGLPGANRLADNPELKKLIQNHHSKGKTVAAVCAGPRALAAAGVLTHRRITCYPGSMSDLNGSWEESDKAVEIDENIITGRGPGVAIDFALSLVENLFGSEKRNEVNRALSR